MKGKPISQDRVGQCEISHHATQNSTQFKNYILFLEFFSYLGGFELQLTMGN